MGSDWMGCSSAHADYMVIDGLGGVFMGLGKPVDVQPGFCIYSKSRLNSRFLHNTKNLIIK
jgi:hypothetical protein